MRSSACILVVLGLALSACERGQQDESSETTAETPDAGQEATEENVTLSHMAREHELEGQVVALDSSAAEIVISHDAVPSLELPSTNTQFLLDRSANAEGLQPGDDVNVVVVRDNQGRFVVREIIENSDEAGPTGQER